MKTKTVTIAIQLPTKFKWLACQPWGEWVAFVRKPRFLPAHDYREGDFIPHWWVGAGSLVLVDLDMDLYPQSAGDKAANNLRRI